jgi:hypothetical protein
MSRFLAAQASRLRDEVIQNSIRGGIPDDRYLPPDLAMHTHSPIGDFLDAPKQNCKCVKSEALLRSITREQPISVQPGVTLVL